MRSRFGIAVVAILLVSIPISLAAVVPTYGATIGVAVNGTCQAGNCSPSLLTAQSEFLPFTFKVALPNGDAYSIAGTADSLLSSPNNSGNSSSFNFIVTYLGNGQSLSNTPSQTDTLTIQRTYGFSSSAAAGSTQFWYIPVAASLINVSSSSGISVSGAISSQGQTSLGSGSSSGPGFPYLSLGNSYVTNGAGFTVSESYGLMFGAGTPVGATIAANSAVPPPLLAAVLPDSRSVQVNGNATIFATMINSGANPLNNCQITLPSSAPSSMSLLYQTTNSQTNALTGAANSPVSIAANSAQSFLLNFQSTAATSAAGLASVFACDGAVPAAVASGVNTVDLLFSATPVPDIVVLAATASNNGILQIASGTTNGAFAVATSNLGAAGTITVSANTGGVSLPLAVTLCQSNPSTSQCLGTPTASLTTTIGANATPTFAIFANVSGTIPLLPATNRIFVTFKDGAGTLHGSTSVAVATN